MELKIAIDDVIEQDEVVALYAANGWSSAQKPKELMAALRNSDSLVTARVSGKLAGLGNAISDGHLVVYYPHLLVHPDFQGQGIGRKIMELLQAKYGAFHQQMVVSGGDTVEFYQKAGFAIAGKTVPMWVYAGNEH